MPSPVGWPPSVVPGDRVGVAALSGPVDGDKLDLGLAELESLGFEPVLGTNVRLAKGLFAGDDDERLDGFHQLAADPSLKAIFFARGGHGVLRLLPSIDWALLARHPRAYVGYSDVTLLLNQIVQRLDLVALHGPMVGVELARGLLSEERESLLAALRGEPSAVPVEAVGPAGSTAEGPLRGGCLSLLTAGLGTSYEVDTAGSVLFWEDVHEPLYRLDRMLTQLDLSGNLRRIQGMVVGRFQRSESSGSEGPSHPPSPSPEALKTRLSELTLDSEGPIAMSCPSGHCEPNMTLALGSHARLDLASQQLVMLP